VHIHDNRKLPDILGGARIVAEPTRTSVSVIALHQSIASVAAWPVKAPLTDDLVAAYVDDDVFPALLAMTLADDRIAFGATVDPVAPLIWSGWTTRPRSSTRIDAPRSLHLP